MRFDLAIRPQKADSPPHANCILSPKGAVGESLTQKRLHTTLRTTGCAEAPEPGKTDSLV